MKQATSPPLLSQARARAEREWAWMMGEPCAADASPAQRRERKRARLREWRRFDGTVMSGRLRGWRGA